MKEKYATGAKICMLILVLVYFASIAMSYVHLSSMEKAHMGTHDCPQTLMSGLYIVVCGAELKNLAISIDDAFSSITTTTMLTLFVPFGVLAYFLRSACFRLILYAKRMRTKCSLELSVILFSSGLLNSKAH